MYTLILVTALTWGASLAAESNPARIPARTTSPALVRPESFKCSKCSLCAKCNQCKLCKLCELFTVEFEPCKQCSKCSLCNDCKFCKTCSAEELAAGKKNKFRKGNEDLFDMSKSKQFINDVYWNAILLRRK